MTPLAIDDRHADVVCCRIGAAPETVTIEPQPGERSSVGGVPRYAHAVEYLYVDPAELAMTRLTQVSEGPAVWEILRLGRSADGLGIGAGEKSGDEGPGFDRWGTFHAAHNPGYPKQLRAVGGH